MRLYRFSPIKSQEELIEAVNYLHQACHQLCFNTFGRYLPVSGNIGVFSHYEQEFEFLISVRDQLVRPDINYNQKYFQLKEPILVQAQHKIPSATYELLYIRQPDPYRAQVGDIDFVLPTAEHEAFKKTLETNRFRHGARIFHRLEDNMIELCDPDIDAASYVVTKAMRDKLESNYGR